MIGAPLRDAGIEIDELRVRPHEIRECRQDDASEQYGAECDRQSEPGGDLRIDPAVDRPTKPAVVPEPATDGFRGGKAGRR